MSNIINSTQTSPPSLWKRLGPGLLFAGAAVGVSHLVYSTRAGASYGFGLIWLVLLVNFLKYPFFEFGPRYAAATGKSLLQGYKEMGNWVLGIFGLVTLGTMFTVIAAVTLVTASLAANLIGITENLVIWSAILLIICSCLLAIGRYSLLDQLMKIIILLLTVVTIIAVFFAIPQSKGNLNWTPIFAQAEFAFLIAFAGWMPAPLDLSVWHSLWALEKQKELDNSSKKSIKNALFDFNVGYIGTIILALLFMALGALVMFTSGQEFSDKGILFAKQLIEIYTNVLGSTVGKFVAVAAFITMFSTTITCLDALPRSMAKAHFLSVRASNKSNQEPPKKYYWGWLITLIIGGLLILMFLLESMGTFLKVVTILSFLTAPFFAVVNYKLVTGPQMPKEAQPNKKMQILSLLGISLLSIFAMIYLYSIL